MTDTTTPKKGEAVRLSDSELDELEQQHRRFDEWEIERSPFAYHDRVDIRDACSGYVAEAVDTKAAEYVLATRRALPALIGMARRAENAEAEVKALKDQLAVRLDSALGDHADREADISALIADLKKVGAECVKAEARIAELEAKLERYDRLWIEHEWERMQAFSLAHGGEGGDNIITVTLDVAERAEAEVKVLKDQLAVRLDGALGDHAEREATWEALIAQYNALKAKYHKTETRIAELEAKMDKALVMVGAYAFKYGPLSEEDKHRYGVSPTPTEGGDDVS